MSLGGALAFLRPVVAPHLLAALRDPQSGKARAWRQRCQALERTLDELSDRLARTEIALLREEQAKQRAELRQAEAENALVRVQSTLDTLRRAGSLAPEDSQG